MIRHRDDYSWKEYYERAYGKRPEYEFYDLRKDPHQITNLAGQPMVTEVESTLKTRLMAELTRTGDPRVTGDRMFYESPPMTDGK